MGSKDVAASARGRVLSLAYDRHKALGRPVVVAIDGGSGAGKSTLIRQVQELETIAAIPLDDFYQTTIPEGDWLEHSVEDRLIRVFDWERVRCEAIGPLRSKQPARWQPFDFGQGLNGRGIYDLAAETKEISPAPIILIDGAYSASPPLRDLVDLAVLVDVPREERHARLRRRERSNQDWLSVWHSIWDDVEAYYYADVCPPASFDLTLPN